MIDIFRRIGTSLLVVVLVAGLIFLSTMFLPIASIPIYIFGCLLALISVNIRHSRLRDSIASDAITVIDGIALFLFFMIGFRTFMSSNLPGTALALLGITTVLYSASL